MKAKKARKLRKKAMEATINDKDMIKRARIMFGMRDYKKKDVKKEIKKMIKRHIKYSFGKSEKDNPIDRSLKERAEAKNASKSN